MAPPRCANVRALLSAFVDGEISPRDRQLVESHLANCPECSAEVEALKAASSLVRSLPRPELPDDFHASLVRKVNAEAVAARTEAAHPRQGFQGFRGFRFQLRTVAIVAAALIVVFWAGGVAYYMGLPVPGADLLGLRSSDKGSEMTGPSFGVSTSPPGVGGGPNETAGRDSVGAPEGLATGKGGSDTGSSSGNTSGSAGDGVIGLLAVTSAGRQVILTVNLNIECEDVAKARDQAVSAASSSNGFVESMNYWTDANGVTAAQIVLRVPFESLNAVLGQLRPLGEVTMEQASRTDVTAQHIDLTARINSLRLQEQRLLFLLGKAESLGDIFALENELTRVRTEIENYESQLRSLDDQVSFSTINLYLQPVGAGLKPGSGFWQRLADAFLQSLNWLGRLAEQLAIFVATVTVPLLILAGLVWLAYRMVQSRRRKAGL